MNAYCLLIITPFLKSFANRYGKSYYTVVADSTYGSEENHRFRPENGMDNQDSNQILFKAKNFFYSEEQDYYVCPIGQKYGE